MLSVETECLLSISISLNCHVNVRMKLNMFFEVLNNKIENINILTTALQSVAQGDLSQTFTVSCFTEHEDVSFSPAIVKESRKIDQFWHKAEVGKLPVFPVPI